MSTSQAHLPEAPADMCDFLRNDHFRFYDNLPFGYLTLDQEGWVVDINHTAAGMLGAPGQQLRGQNFFSLLDPGDLQILKKKRYGLQNMGTASRINLRIKNNGTRTWIKACIMETGSSDDNCLCLALTDITTQKQTEKELGWQLRVMMELDTITDALSQPDPDYNRITRSILTAAADLTQSRNGFISRLLCRTHSSVEMMLDQIYPEPCDLEPRSMTLTLDDTGSYTGSFGKALNLGRPFFTTPTHTHLTTIKLPKGHIPVDGFLSIPLILNHELKGLMVLANPENTYSQEMVKVVRRLAKLYIITLKLGPAL
ncbi:MAG: PAS domain-containing protein [Desulfotignum sp.]|nr:PAS domain-containing protein [Desulfotignum sp.]